MSIPAAPPGLANRAQKPAKIDQTALVFETLLIFLCFALYAGQLPPDVNESHYLTKAKHFWNPDWCPGDIFLGSSFAHWLFYASTGWLTQFMSLAAVAWIGRIATWGAMAYAWRRLSWNVLPYRWVAVFSAVLFLVLNDRFHLAGEWVIGGFEAKGIAYAFVLMGLGSLAKADWRSAWVWLGAASAFHVLAGGWAFLATMFAFLYFVLDPSNRGLGRINLVRAQLLPFAFGIGLALIGAIPPLLAESSTPADIAVEARSIYVNHRISHHLNFDAFPSLNVARFLGMVLVWCGLSHWLAKQSNVSARRLKPVFYFCLGSLGISFGGLWLSGLAGQGGPLAQTSEGLLRFYWFRLADFAVPMAGALMGSSIVCHLLMQQRRFSARIGCAVFVACIVMAGGLTIFEKHQDPRPRADRRSLPSYEENVTRTQDTFRNWQKVCRWVAANTPQDSSFITPHEQQTFKWYAGRAEVVCWKDVPQDAGGILEWKTRLNELYEPQRRYEAGLFSYSDDQLRSLANKYKADYLVIPQRHVDLAGSPTSLKQVYPENDGVKSTYVVFEF
jgi:hypothetical protein